VFWDCSTWTLRAVAWAKSREKFVVGSGISTFVKFPNTNAVFYLKQKGGNKRRVKFVIRIPCFSWKTWLLSKEWPGNFSPAPWVVYLIEIRVTSMNVNLSLSNMFCYVFVGLSPPHFLETLPCVSSEYSFSCVSAFD